jgi:hypothetical protein
VAAALDFAHERGVVHRDVKPGNVMVARDGRVALADFGLALDVEQGSLGETFGSARYVAPEQARRSSAAVPQSDLYSLGVMLYEMLAGQVPFDDPSPTSLALQHVMLPPPPPRSVNPDLRPATEAVLLKALAKQPEARYQRGRELIDALAGSLAPAAADTAPLAVRPARPRSGRAFWLLLLGLVLVAAMAAGVALALVTNARAGEGQAATRTVAPAATGPAGGAPPTAAALAPAAGTAAANQLLLPVAPAALPTASAAPPLVIAAGRPLQLYYDPASFYVLNPGASPLGIKPIAFEALDAAGQPAAYRFEGSQWSQFYFFLESGACDRIEILRSPAYLRPGQCRRYNATVTPQDDDPMIFWIARPGVSQFRVLWAEQEVGRCPVDGGFCEVYLPL